MVRPMSRRAVPAAFLTAALAFTAAPLGPVGPSGAAEPDPGREAAVGWTPPSRVYPPGRRAYEPRLAASPEGDVTVVWSVGDGRILSRTKQRGEPWGPLRQVGRGFVEDVESDASGAVTAVWTRGAGGGRNVVMAATRPDAGAWSRPRRISRIPRSVGTFTQHGPVELEVSPGGAAVAAWTLESQHGGARARPEANYRPPGGQWGRPVRIGPLDTSLYGLAMGPDGVPSALGQHQAPVGSARRSAARGPMAPWWRVRSAGPERPTTTWRSGPRVTRCWLWSTTRRPGTARTGTGSRGPGWSTVGGPGRSASPGARTHTGHASASTERAWRP